ncbi:TIGR02301 family protein [Youhaiella tibetensis]|uniref:TIGR02301 family protein n=1 Tax=Paradevosia tibetensis TaxID=1447062 RepID=A0A5B9DKJ4_9HYPH|nr:TIGR02301 family protein [Youhaiella tibetensis]
MKAAWHHRIRTTVRLVTVLATVWCLPSGARAVDPLYQPQMERLAEIMGSLYFLEPLCKAGGADWRAQMEALIAADEPDEDRRQRLAGAFNSGYTSFARLYEVCTDSASEALTRLLAEAEKTARDIHSRYAE